MNNLKKWKYFPLNGKDGLFSIESCKCNDASELLVDGDDIEYIGAKKNDNGFMRMVKYDGSLVTKGNCIIFICDGQGSVGYTNYIDHDFIGSTTLSVGYNENLNERNALFLVTVLDLERYRYSFGRKYKTNLVKTKIKLPSTDDGQPDWQYMERFIDKLNFKKVTTKNLCLPGINLNTKSWQDFLLGKLFDNIYKSYAYIKSDLTFFSGYDKGRIPFISRTDINNGCDGYVPISEIDRIEKGNAIIIGDTTSTIYYQKENFVTGDHIVICRANWINQYTALFIKTLIERERYKYNYGRAFKMDLIKNTKIKLPVLKKDNEHVIDNEKTYSKYGYIPDWEWIENYMKSLPYGDRIDD